MAIAVFGGFLAALETALAYEKTGGPAGAGAGSAGLGAAGSFAGFSALFTAGAVAVVVDVELVDDVAGLT